MAHSLASHADPAPLPGGDHRPGGQRRSARRIAGRPAGTATGQTHPQLTEHHYLAHVHSKTVFVLPGEGAQYPGMGRELYEHNNVFADAIDNICDALDAHLEFRCATSYSPNQVARLAS